MISQIPINFLRFFILLFAQVLIFSNINLSTFINPYIFPLFLLLLPFETPRWLLVILGFGAGLVLDFFLGSIGMHAAVCLALGFFRPSLINLITPKGTDFEISPNVYAQGVTWFIIYLSRLQLITNTKLSNFSLAAKLMAPVDSGSSISPSPKKTQTFLFWSSIKDLFCKYFINLAW